MADGIWMMADGGIDRQPYAISPQPSAIDSDTAFDSDRHGAAAAIVDLRNRDPQLAAGQRRLGMRRVAGVSEPHHAREAAVAALDEMKARFAARAAGGLLAGDQQAVPLGEHSNAGRLDAGQVDRDLERIVGLVDVERR